MPAFDHVTLQTRRLLLRPLQETDAPSVLAMFTDAKFMRFGTTPPFESMEEAQALVARDIKAMASGERNGVLTDSALYGLLRSEWKKRDENAAPTMPVDIGVSDGIKLALKAPIK